MNPRKYPLAAHIAVLMPTLAMVCGCLSACQTSPLSELDTVFDSAPEQTDSPLLSTSEIYINVMEDLLLRQTDPYGDIVLLSEDPKTVDEYNKFAVYDIDRDGKEELILQYATDIYAGWSLYVLDYNEETEELHIQLDTRPEGTTFYDNGSVTSKWSHAMSSWGGDFWPYTLYKYQPASDSYVVVGNVDAWSKELSDNADGFPAFPQEIDVSGSGYVYYIWYPSETSFEKDDPVDASVYEAWWNTHVGDTSELSLPYQSLTLYNIQTLRETSRD